jgi:N-acylneuraminate cytidylyltransferase
MVPVSAYVIVPARGGSKGIPRKNLRQVGGESLVARAVRAARQATTVERVFVSTDDPEIAAVAEMAGAEVVIRPDDLADDSATSESALLHALDAIERRGVPEPATVVMVQCTSPLTTGAEIDGTVAALEAEAADCAFTASRSHAFLWQHSSAGAVAVNHDASQRPRRQDQTPQFADTGSVYAMRTAGFRAARHRFFGRIAMFEVAREHEVEIDSEADFALVEVLLQLAARRRDAASLPMDVEGVAFDFDGVLTDNRVLTTSDGTEAVACDRSDGLGIEMLCRVGVDMIVLSKETNPVVAARCAKIGVEVVQSVGDKVSSFSKWIAERGFDPKKVVFVGNDVNDVECLRLAGCGVAVADAHPAALAVADLVLSKRGGAGAVRELADLILDRRKEADPCPKP